MTALQKILDEIRTATNETSQWDKGTRFEQLILQFFKNDPAYSKPYNNVWSWQDFPLRDGKIDTGIDLVCELADGTGYVAVQCKFYAEETTIQKSDIDSFLVTSSKSPFVRRIIVSTTANWSKHAEDALNGLQPSVQRIGIPDLENSAIDWSQFSFNKPSQVVLKPKKELRPHQITAVESVQKGFETQDRGKLIMACGTGKTFTSLKIAERMAGKGGRVLFLVPSLSLMSQTLHEWTAESTIPLHAFAVCSDVKVGKHDDTDPTRPDDIAIPATTDAKKLAETVLQNPQPKKMTVVFSTYQSIDVISQAQKLGLPEFDLVIGDEAHRTTGVTLSDADESQFVRVHDAKFIEAKKRLYMTATPRLYGDESKKKADEAGAVLCSMDDESLYGGEFHRLGFSDAVSKGLLSDYKVIILAVSEKHVGRAVQNQLKGSGGEIELDDAVKIIGCWNGLARKFIEEENAERKPQGKHPEPMQRAVAFTTTIKQSENFKKQFAQLVKEYLKMQPDDKQTLQCEVEHVDGKLNTLLRTKRLEWLKSDEIEKKHCRILSNAKCLSEGVDVPALDAVIFLNPRKSKVDVVQSVGRVMRKAPGKDYGYIILPIGIPADTTPEEALSNNEKYKVVWDVLQALRAHDDRFNVTINQIDLNKDRPDTIQVIGIGDEEPEHEMTTPFSAQSFFDFGDIEEWKNAIYGKIVIKCGEKRYWEEWAKDVSEIAQKHSEKIRELLANEEHALQFASFLAGLRLDLNPDITEDDAIEMLSQHLITKPVFDALFGNSEFTAHNPVSLAMEKMIGLLEDVQQGTEQSSLNEFYKSVQKRASGVDNAEGKQKIVIELYDKFFKSAFPLMAQRLGIVYTPLEVVDFILHSVDHVLKTEFGGGFNAKGNDILDPFTGTGTFIVRLLQSGLIAPENLRWEYENEIHANELVLLAYYIAAVNIEQTFQEVSNVVSSGEFLVSSEENPPNSKRETRNSKLPYSYTPFPGIVLTDTFNMTQEKRLVDENSKRAKRQRDKKIRVIIGNPPYSAGQRSENDANKNTKYPALDERISHTYAANSTATNKNSLYDSYIRAFRWASDRIGEKGIICFVTNNGYIDKKTMDGFRKCLADEFTTIYCFNLRGSIRGRSKDAAKREGQSVFEIMTGVAITLLVKNPDRKSSREEDQNE